MKKVAYSILFVVLYTTPFMVLAEGPVYDAHLNGVINIRCVMPTEYTNDDPIDGPVISIFSLKYGNGEFIPVLNYSACHMPLQANSLDNGQYYARAIAVVFGVSSLPSNEFAFEIARSERTPKSATGLTAGYQVPSTP